MPGIFYSLGRMVGPKVRKAKWVYNSVTGSEADVIRAEYGVGRDMAKQVAGEVDFDDSPATRHLLTDIGGRLAGRLKHRERKFAFRATRTNELNAFVLPGGFVYVTCPLLEMCRQDEAELAFILAHEMAHVVRGHAINRIMNSSMLKVASRLNVYSRAMRSKVVQVGMDMLTKAYAQDQELEADSFAARLTHSAGYDPTAGLRVLAKLNQQGDRPGATILGEYFSTHPPYEIRTAALRRVLHHRS